MENLKSMPFSSIFHTQNILDSFLSQSNDWYRGTSELLQYFRLYCRGSSHRRKSAAWHRFDMVWLFRSPIPVRRRAVIYTFKRYLPPAFAALRGMECMTESLCGGGRFLDFPLYISFLHGFNSWIVKLLSVLVVSSSISFVIIFPLSLTWTVDHHPYLTQIWKNILYCGGGRFS